MTKRMKCGLKIILALSMVACSQPSGTTSVKEEDSNIVEEASAYTVMDIELPDFTYVPIKRTKDILLLRMESLG